MVGRITDTKRIIIQAKLGQSQMTRTITGNNTEQSTVRKLMIICDDVGQLPVTMYMTTNDMANHQ